MTHATAAYAVSGLPFTVDEGLAAGLQKSRSFSADELLGEYLGTHQQPAPGVIITEFVIRWNGYFLNATHIGSLLNRDDVYGYGLTAKITVEQSLGPAPQPGALRGNLAIYTSLDPTPLGSPHIADRDELVCTGYLVPESSEYPLNLSDPRGRVARLRFSAVSLTPWGAMYWQGPRPFYAEMELDLEIGSSSTESGVLQGSVILHFVIRR